MEVAVVKWEEKEYEYIRGRELREIKGIDWQGNGLETATMCGRSFFRESSISLSFTFLHENFCYIASLFCLTIIIFLFSNLKFFAKVEYEFCA